MEIITYSLRNCKQNSELYYKEVALFSDIVLDRLQEVTNTIIDDFIEFIKRHNPEEYRSREEYMIEFLSLGVFLYVYRDKAKKLHPIPQKLLSSLSLARRKSGFVKPGVDRLRGILATTFLNVNKDISNDLKNLSIKDMLNLINWMEASGDFRFAVERLRNWYKFLKNNSEVYTSTILNKSLILAEWFKTKGEQALGKYTSSVDSFLLDKYPKYRFREDIIFCGSKEIQYHLNMVGAEILNRAFKEDFIKTNVKMVLLPACMRFHSSESCKAVSSYNGYICANCTDKCNVAKLAKMGRDNNFKVYIIPHESDAFSKGRVQKGEVGIVGVACALNLLEGGWKARSLNFIPQCVLLDYCGCKNHWHPLGIQTDINIQQLKRVLQI